MGLRPPEEPESARDRRRGPSRSALLAVAAACACACALFGWAAWSYASAPAPAGDAPAASAGAAPDDAAATGDVAATPADDAGTDAPADDDARPGTGAPAPDGGDDGLVYGGTTSAPGVPAPSAGHDDAPAAQGSPEAPQAPAPDDGRIRVTVLLDASAAGGPSRSVSVTLGRGATAYDALVATGAAVGARPSPFGTYVTSVDGLAAGERGGESGWKYSVDGAVPNVACSSFSLSDGQSVRWYYALRADD